MESEKITFYRTNEDKTKVIEQLPKTVVSQVYDSDNEQFLHETLIELTDHNKNDTDKKHIEVVSSVPNDFAEMGILMMVDGSSPDVPSMVTVDVLNENVLSVSEKLEETEQQLEQATYHKLNAKSYGIVADNLTDNYTSLNTMFREALNVSHTVYDTTILNNRIMSRSIDIPAGVYRIKSANLFASALNVRATNLVINGNGAVLVFEDFEGFAFRNDNLLLNISFVNFTFISINDAKAPNRGFFYSYADGGAQDVKFENCTFAGTWKYGVQLEGANNNSEFVWDKCTFTGKWDAFLYIGATNTSDQFLNYWFDKCKYWNNSTWIKAYKGGHFKIEQCDVSGYTPTQETYLFELLGGAHSRGVTTFIDNDSRYELKSTHAKVLRCEWDNARIAFTNVDMGSQGFVAMERANVFDLRNNTSGDESNYKFDNCVLLGRFLLRSSSRSPLNNVYLKNCHLMGDSTTSKINDIFTYSKGSNPVEFIKVNLENTKFGGKIYNTTLDRFSSSHVFLKNNSFFSVNPSGMVDTTWNYTITSSVLLDETIIIGRNYTNSNTYSFALKSDLTAVVESVVPASKQIIISLESVILPGNKLTFGNSNTVYTVASHVPRTRTIVVTEEITETINVGAKISFQVNSFTFIPMQQSLLSVVNTKYQLTSDVYVKDLAGNFPTIGVPARVIVKTIE